MAIYCYITTSPQTSTNQRAFAISQLPKPRPDWPRCVFLRPLLRSWRDRCPGQTAGAFHWFAGFVAGGGRANGGWVLSPAGPKLCCQRGTAQGAESCSRDAAAPKGGPGGRQCELRTPRASTWGDRGETKSLGRSPRWPPWFAQSCMALVDAGDSCPDRQLKLDAGP